MTSTLRNQKPTVREALLQLSGTTLLKEAVAEVKVGKPAKKRKTQSTQPAKPVVRKRAAKPLVIEAISKRARLTHLDYDDDSGEYKPESEADDECLSPRALRSLRRSTRKVQAQNSKTAAQVKSPLKLSVTAHSNDEKEEDEDEVRIIAIKSLSLASSEPSASETTPRSPGKNTAESIVVETKVGKKGADEFEYQVTPATPTVDSDPNPLPLHSNLDLLVLASQQANVQSHNVQTELLMPPQPSAQPAPMLVPATQPQPPSLPSFTFSCERLSPSTAYEYREPLPPSNFPSLNEFSRMHLTRDSAVRTPLFAQGPLPLPHSVQSAVHYLPDPLTRLPSFNELVSSIEGVPKHPLECYKVSF
ncbi:hypothetical protein F5Y08DRAFT_342877 [Xylaria arbuscula]|nr:hypothetical protein F5Y08DRAFT_342877 [Xylaria arbuscula]